MSLFTLQKMTTMQKKFAKQNANVQLSFFAIKNTNGDVHFGDLL